MSKLFIYSLVYSAFLFSCNTSSGSGIDNNSNSIQEGRNAYFQMDHEKAYIIFQNVWQDKSQSTEDRVSAGSTMARMDWLFYQKTDKALAMINEVLTLNYRPSGGYILQARILTAEMRFAEAIEAAEKALELGQSETEQYASLFRLTQTILSKHEQDILMGKSKVEIDEKTKEVYAILQREASEKPGDVDMAGLYLGLSLLMERGENAFDAWMSFYRLTEISQVHASLLNNAEAFKQALEQYGKKGSDELVTKAVIKGLAESGFKDYAMMLKRIHFGEAATGDEQIDDLVRYMGFLDQVKKHTMDFYYRTLNGDSDRKDFQKAIRAEGKKLWEELSREEEAPLYSYKSFKQEIERRFKAIMTNINANGYYGLHMGHVVVDDNRLISQYDQSAMFRYISIDHMVSNGYSGWFWDGAAETGGWASNNGAFLQVRSAYTTGPVNSWLMVTDPIELEKTKERIAQLSIADDSIALKDPHAFLPGLSLRNTFDQRNKLLNKLKSEGLKGAALRLAYINEIERKVQGSSIYAHEGRHAIDKKNDYSRSSNELEYTAKLSEIYFAEMPFLAFRAVMNRNIGDRTSHGQANLRLMKNLVGWMSENQGEIAGFEASRPVLPQIDKLTDKQLKEAVLSFDPMAN